MKRIRSIQEWQKVLEQSIEEPILLFKYSMTCLSSVSAMKELKAIDTKRTIYMIIVQMDRPVSNAIERDLGVKHESPQFLIMKDKKGIWQATHYKIKKSLVTEALHTYA